jgi:3-methyladenine DNA glycosylase AlkD
VPGHPTRGNLRTASAPGRARGGAGAKAANAAGPDRAPQDIQEKVQAALASLGRMSTRKDRDNLARFGITAERALGVSMASIQALAKRLGRSHELAAALWDTGCYEARLLTAFVDEPGRVTAAQMERWCRDFDNWAVCDTLCFKLFDATPHAWGKVRDWCDAREELVRRAAFALLASLAGHDRVSGDEPFLASLPAIERAATDDRNFVKKGVSWALRSLGRRGARLHAAAVALARRLSSSTDPSARWVGKDALRDLTGPVVRRRLAAQRRNAAAPARRKG